MRGHGQAILAFVASVWLDSGRGEYLYDVCAFGFIDDRFSFGLVDEDARKVRLVEGASKRVGCPFVGIGAASQDIQRGVENGLVASGCCPQRYLLVLKLAKRRGKILLLVSGNVPWHASVHRELGPLEPLALDFADSCLQLA